MGEKQSKSKSPSGDVETTFRPKLSDRNYGRQYVSHGLYGERDERLGEYYSAADSLVNLLSASVDAKADTPSAPTQLPSSQPPPRAEQGGKLADKNASELRGKKSSRSKRKSGDGGRSRPVPVTTESLPSSPPLPEPQIISSSSEAPSPPSVSSTRTNEH